MNPLSELRSTPMPTSAVGISVGSVPLTRSPVKKTERNPLSMPISVGSVPLRAMLSCTCSMLDRRMS